MKSGRGRGGGWRPEVQGGLDALPALPHFSTRGWFFEQGMPQPRHSASCGWRCTCGTTTQSHFQRGVKRKGYCRRQVPYSTSRLKSPHLNSKITKIMLKSTVGRGRNGSFSDFPAHRLARFGQMRPTYALGPLFAISVLILSSIHQRTEPDAGSPTADAAWDPSR
jgi:hypothetical protein